MPRRPKFIVGNIYWVKIKDHMMGKGSFPVKSGFIPAEYIMELKAIELNRLVNDDAFLDMKILASTNEHIPSSNITRDKNGKLYYMRHVRVDDYIERPVFQNYNPKNLPLYLNWAGGRRWINCQLKGIPHDGRCNE